MNLWTRLTVACGLLLLSAPVLAGEAYTFVTVRQDGFNDSTTKGRILVDGTKYRTEYEPEKDDPTQPRQAVISRDGGEHRFTLNLENRTFYELDEAPASATSPLFMLLTAWGDRSVADVKVDVVEKAEPETVGGNTVRRRDITLAYGITVKLAPPPPVPGMPAFKGPRETVRGKVKLEAVYWMAEDKAPLPAGLFAPEIRTGFPEVDGKLAEALATLRGLAVKQQVTVSTEGDSYMTARSSSVTTTVEGPRPVKTQAAQFEVPSGFKMHKPEFTRPGMGDVPHTLSLPGAEGPP